MDQEAVAGFYIAGASCLVLAAFPQLITYIPPNNAYEVTVQSLLQQLDPIVFVLVGSVFITVASYFVLGDYYQSKRQVTRWED